MRLKAMEAQRWPSLTETGNGDGGLSCPSPLRCPVLPAGIPAAEKPSLSPHPPLEVSRPVPPPGHLQFHVSPIWPVTSEVLVCASVCAHVCASLCVPVSGCTASVCTRCMSVRVCTLDACVHVCICLWPCACVSVCTCVHMYVCLYACGHICLHMCVFE